MSVSCWKCSFSSSFLPTRAHADTHTQTAAFHTFPEVRSILPKELAILLPPRPLTNTALDLSGHLPSPPGPLAPWLLSKTDMQTDTHTHTHNEGTRALAPFRHNSTALGGRRTKARQLEHLGEGMVSCCVMENHCRSVWRPRRCRVCKSTRWFWVRWDFGSILTNRPC